MSEAKKKDTAKPVDDKTTKQAEKVTLPEYIILKRRGVKSCGRFMAGIKYKVGTDLTPEEADHLVRNKGFVKAGKDD